MIKGMSDFSILVKEVRRQLGLSQEALAQELRVSYATINRWENGRARPSPLAMQRIEELLRSMGDDGVDLLERGLVNR